MILGVTYAHADIFARNWRKLANIIARKNKAMRE